MTAADYDIRVDWNGDGDFSDTGEDLTARTLSRETITIAYGRDQARSMSPIRPGDASMMLNNTSRDYSPENSGSPLAGLVSLPARPVRIQATHSAVTYGLFRGYTDDYEVLPEKATRGVRLSCTDLLGARLRGERITTGLHHSIQTGDALHLVLDEIGWPLADRDIDRGATTIRWFYEADADALTAVTRIVNSEGPPALATVDIDGRFVFRDRHHRLVRAASLTSQATFRGTGTEPVHDAPMAYDHGAREIINSVTIPVADRVPAGEPTSVWSSSRVYSIADGQTVPIQAVASDPVYSVLTPEAGTDYVLDSGTVQITLSATSGPAITLFVTAVGGPAVVHSLQLRGYPLEATTTQVHAEESVSIGRYGRRSMPASLDAPWLNENDAEAVAEIILGYRAERLPVVHIHLSNYNSTRLTQQLERDLSDRVTIIEDETALSADFFVERIHHVISDGGLRHQTTFGCEKRPTPTAGFILDTSLLDTGVLGSIGLDDPATIFILDDGLLGTEVLAH